LVALGAKRVWPTTVRPFCHRIEVCSSNLWKVNAVSMLKTGYVNPSRWIAREHRQPDGHDLVSAWPTLSAPSLPRVPRQRCFCVGVDRVSSARNQPSRAWWQAYVSPRWRRESEVFAMPYRRACLCPAGAGCRPRKAGAAPDPAMQPVPGRCERLARCPEAARAGAVSAPTPGIVSRS
jgi:hypothetical protein